MFTWDSIKDLLTPTNSSSRLVLSSAQCSRGKQEVILVVIWKILTFNRGAKRSVFMMMKTTIASMKLCGHSVSHAHTHILSSIV